MSRIPVMVPVSELRGDVAKVLRRLGRSSEPVVVTQRGRAAAVLLNVREYERAAYERGVLLALLRGEKEVAAGKGYDLDDVMAEADALLADDEP